MTAQPRLHKRKYGNVEKEEVKTLPAEQSQLEKCGIEEKYAVLTLTQTNVLLFICWRNLNFTYEAHARRIHSGYR